MAGLDTIIGVGAEGLDWWQQRENLGDAKDAVQEGYDQGAKDLKNYQEPYTQFGLEHMQGYNDLGEFNFQFDESDPSYQWRRDQGLQGVMRQQAGKKMVGSGNTLTALTDYGQNAASQEYQAEYLRDLGAYQENRGYHEFGVNTGAKAAQNLGDNLASMAIGEGADMSKLYAAQATINNRAISDIAAKFAGGDSGAVSGLLKDGLSYAADKLGLSGDAAMDWVADKFGVAKDAVQGILGIGGSSGAAAGAAGMFGTSTGLSTGAGAMAGGFNGAAGMGALPADFGGAFTAGLEGSSTATGASLATSGFGTWAASVAGGFGVLMGIHMLNQALGTDPKIGKTLVKISKSEDPLGYIGNLKGKDVSGLFARDEMIGRDSMQYIGGEGWVEGSHANIAPNVSGNASKGMLYGMILGGMPQEGIEAIRTRDDVATISQDLLNALVTGRSERNEYTGEMVGDPTAGMAKLFPELADDLTRLRALSSQVRSASSYNQDYAGDFNGITRTERDVPLAERDALATQIQAEMDKTLERWANTRVVAGLSAV